MGCDVLCCIIIACDTVSWLKVATAGTKLASHKNSKSFRRFNRQLLYEGFSVLNSHFVSWLCS